MTNGEMIQTILDVDRDCTEVHGENGTMTFTVTQDFWNAKHKEPTTNNDLGVDCISRAEVLKIFDEWFATCDISDKKDSPKAKIKALPSVTPQKPILDKIRAEIEKEIIPRNSDQYDHEAMWQNLGLRMALKVIDKYKAESKPQESEDKGI